MIKKYADAKAENSNTGAREKLPVGGYVCKIISAKVEETQWGDKLVLAFDIAEGEYKDFYKRDFDANTNDDKKWRGTFRLNIPADDGSEQDGWAKKRFNNFIYALEDGNTGYTFDWDEKKLKGKMIGIVFGNKEWEFNGRSGWSTYAAYIYDVTAIREGKYKPAKDKPLANKPVETASAFTALAVVDDGDLPF